MPGPEFVTPRTLIYAIDRDPEISPKDLSEQLDFPLRRVMAAVRMLHRNGVVKFNESGGVMQPLVLTYPDEPSAVLAARNAGIDVDASVSRQ